MTPEVQHVLDEVRGVWRFRWWGLAAAFAIALLGWLVVFALPDRFMAEARVFVDTRTALKPALQGLTVDQNVDAQINFVRQALLEGPQLESIAKETGVLPPSVTDERKKAALLYQFSQRVTLIVATAGTQYDERSTAGSIYEFHYEDASRRRALAVVDRLLNTFVEQTLGGKRQGSEKAQQFLESQIKDYEQRLSAAEDKLANFKKKNLGLMPSEQGGYFEQLQKETDAAKKTEIDLSIAVSRREELVRQLHSDQVVSAAGNTGRPAGTSNAAGGDTLSRIQQTQAKLDELLLKYTDHHPDVIATRATLEELKKRREEELTNLRKGDAAAVAASGAGSNPVYQSMELELNKVDVEIAALRQELARHQGAVADLKQRLNSAPLVEAEYQQLNRDYDVNKAQYTALLQSYQKASLGERADSAGSLRFEVVLPPTAPVVPVWPKRTKLIAVIWLLALAAGAGVAYGLHWLKPSVGSVRAVNELTAFPVLGVVGGAFPTRERAHWRRDLWGFSAATAALLALVAIALLLNWAGVHLSIPLVGESMVKT
jgi:polysaccharide chain length determinant protein (PEP-CTERM system associated)